jgi:hypothetical protein
VTQLSKTIDTGAPPLVDVSASVDTTTGDLVLTGTGTTGRTLSWAVGGVVVSVQS